MATVQANNIQIHYEIYGSGSPLIMIMGLGANMNWWDPRMIQALSPQFKTILFDNRGTGQSEISDCEYSITLFVNDVAGLMDALQIPKAHILGISMGGMIAQELVLHHPEKVEKLILCSTYCGSSRGIPPSLDTLGMITGDRTNMTPEDITRRTLPALFTKGFLDDNPEFINLTIQQLMVEQTSEDVLMRQMNAIIQFDTFERLPQISTHTLILHGKRDILLPPDNAAVMAQAIPNSHLVYFEKSAHGLAEEMDDVVLIVKKFLAE
ncbi:MAG: alpha/beta hydrolase [Chloroflexota bacterium]|nr:alpha/beta hydrolase [Chloroflexota bacterium]